MTMPDERRKSIKRTRDFLTKILSREYEDGQNYQDLWDEARCCLKHFPWDIHMEDAQELAPEVFGDWKSEEKLTEVVVGGIVHTANEGYYYRRSIQDDGRTVKFFVEKKYE